MEKPTVRLVGEDGNIFNLMGRASRALKNAGMSEQAKEMQEKIMSSGSYDKALQIIMEYCEVE